MIAVLIELTLLLAVALAVDRLAATRLPPRLRHAFWTLVGLRLIVPGGLPWPGAVIEIDAAAVPAAALSSPALFPAWWLIAWAVGAALVALDWTARYRRARRRLEPLPATGRAGIDGMERLRRELGVRRLPSLWVDPTATLPYVTGFSRQRLVLPPTWRDWDAPTLHHALAHELMHVVRHDLRIEAAWLLLSCAYWFHPLVHRARRRAHDVREMCCDADVAARVGSEYPGDAASRTRGVCRRRTGPPAGGPRLAPGHRTAARAGSLGLADARQTAGDRHPSAGRRRIRRAALTHHRRPTRPLRSPPSSACSILPRDSSSGWDRCTCGTR